MKDLEGPFVGELLGERVRVVMGLQDALGHGPACDRGSAQNSHGGDDGQLLELSVSQPRAE